VLIRGCFFLLSRQEQQEDAGEDAGKGEGFLHNTDLAEHTGGLRETARRFYFGKMLDFRPDNVKIRV
jgi:hypothetical protein